MALTDIIYTTRQKLTELYDAIREKAGVTGTMTIDQATEAVESIQTGGIDPKILKNLINGYGSYSEPIAYLDLNEILGSNVSILDYALYSRRCLRVVKLPHIDLDRAASCPIGQYAFTSCENMTLYGDEIVAGTISKSAFSACHEINPLRIIATTRIDEAAFKSCSSMTTPAIITPGALATQCFRGCSNMERVWLDGRISSIYAQTAGGTGSVFYDCSSLTDIYTDATEKPSGWGQYFAYTSASNVATVHYGVSLEEYEAMDEGEPEPEEEEEG